LTLKIEASEMVVNISDHSHLSCIHVFLTVQFKGLHIMTKIQQTTTYEWLVPLSLVCVTKWTTDIFSC